MKIAVGGIQHETNTSAATTALDAFRLGGGWPGWQKGEQIASALGAMNLPITGAIDALVADARVGNANLVPLMWAAATPSGRVEDEAFDALRNELIERIVAAGELDGLYLDLHGAMATVSYDDAEGELLARIRTEVGNALPIVISLDLHANISRRSFELCDAMVVYRTYPHTDMYDSGQRAARLLIRRVERGRPWERSMAEIAFIAPLTAQCTLAEPAHSLMAMLEQTEHDDAAVSLSWASGFPLADVSCRGQTVLAYGDSKELTDQTVERLANAIKAKRSRFIEAPLLPYDAVREAVTKQRLNASGPVILCDTDDNPGAGAASDNVAILRALVAHHADQAVVAIVCDPEAASAAHAAGAGRCIQLSLGGKSAGPCNTPFEAAFIVERVTNGQFTGTGPMWRGSSIDLGPMTLLRVDGSQVRVIVSSRTMQAADQSIFRHVGIEPGTTHVLALKSSVHFRADFNAVASSVIVVRTASA